MLIRRHKPETTQTKTTGPTEANNKTTMYFHELQDTWSLRLQLTLMDIAFWPAALLSLSLSACGSTPPQATTTQEIIAQLDQQPVVQIPAAEDLP